jgi:hypothetical protein
MLQRMQLAWGMPHWQAVRGQAGVLMSCHSGVDIGWIRAFLPLDCFYVCQARQIAWRNGSLNKVIIIIIKLPN